MADTSGQHVPPPSRYLLRSLRDDRLLLGAFAVCVLLIGYQLSVTLLQPPWIKPVTDWLRSRAGVAAAARGGLARPPPPAHPSAGHHRLVLCHARPALLCDWPYYLDACRCVHLSPGRALSQSARSLLHLAVSLVRRRPVPDPHPGSLAARLTGLRRWAAVDERHHRPLLVLRAAAPLAPNTRIPGEQIHQHVLPTGRSRPLLRTRRCAGPPPSHGGRAGGPVPAEPGGDLPVRRGYLGGPAAAPPTVYLPHRQRARPVLVQLLSADSPGGAGTLASHPRSAAIRPSGRTCTAWLA